MENKNFQLALQETLSQAWGFVTGPVFRIQPEVDGTPVELATLFNHAMEDAGEKPWQCSTCNNFINRYGSLATIDNEGNITPLLWDVKRMQIEDKAAYAVCEVMAKYVTNGTVTSRPCINIKKIHGKPQWGGFTHLHLPALTYNNGTDVLNHVGAANTYTGDVTGRPTRDAEVNFQRLKTLRNDWTKDIDFLKKCLNYLNLVGEGTMALKPKIALLDSLTAFLEETKLFEDGKRADALTWLIAANFGDQKATWKDTALGEFLSTAKEQTMEDAWRLLGSMLKSDVYRVGTKELSEISQIKLNQAKRGLREAGYEASLLRKEAPVSLVHDNSLWLTEHVAEEDGTETVNVLDLLDDPKGMDKQIDITNKLLKATGIEKSFTSFLTEYLPTAKRVWLDNTRGYGSMGFVNTENTEGSKPIMDWDMDDDRNPASWFLLNRQDARGSTSAILWKQMLQERFTEIRAVAKLPCAWTDNTEWADKNSVDGLMFDFTMDGMTNPLMRALGTQVLDSKAHLFPQMLKKDTFEFTQVISALNEKLTVEYAHAYGVFTTTTLADSMPQFAIETKDGLFLNIRINVW